MSEQPASLAAASRLTAARSSYLAQLDGLRAISVLLVLVQHWFDPIIKVGDWGVTVFFVISGYLITRSLMQLTEQGLSWLHAARLFFVRRAARLMPAYLLIVGLWLLLSNQVRADWPWYVFYATNFLLAWRQEWIPLTPTWSLAVEEQFYLVWFAVVMALPARRWGVLCAVLVPLAVFARWQQARLGLSFHAYLPWSVVDALALGALLCHLKHPPKRLWLSLTFLALITTVAMLTWMLAPMGPANSGRFPGAHAVLPLMVALAAMVVVWQAQCHKAGRWLGFPVLTYLGRISYGIYLYHMLAIAVAANLADHAARRGPDWLRPWFTLGGFEGFATHVTLTIVLAALSYHLLEWPIRQTVQRWLDRRQRMEVGLATTNSAPPPSP